VNRPRPRFLAVLGALKERRQHGKNLHEAQRIMHRMYGLASEIEEESAKRSDPCGR
jgi:hypothetical protein